MSGAGKSSVLKMLEDMGYFCVDNLPVQLIPKFAQLTFDPANKVEQVALGVDIRSGQYFDELENILKGFEENGYHYEILFLEANTDVLVKRYKETRRLHPLARNERVDKAIEEERERLSFLKKRANYIVDTSMLLIRELKAEIDKIFVENAEYNSFIVTVLSFGFKYGIPTDSDLVFDVRFLPNPYYDLELRPKTGNDPEVYHYVMDAPQAGEFLTKLEDMLTFLIPNYMIEGKNQLVISIGCTGGKHRSVTIANAIAKRMQQYNYGIKVEHRDIEKDALRKK